MPKFRFAAALHACLLAAAPSFAQGIPEEISIQGRVVRPDGTPETAATQRLVIRVFDVAQGGTALHSEDFQNVPLSAGYFALTLGAAQALPANTFDGRRLFVGIQVGGPGASELLPRLPISTVPYALRANDAADSERLGGQAPSAFAQAGHVHAVATSGADGFMSAADKSKVTALATINTAGTGLLLSAGTLSVVYAGNGAANSAARSDHSHGGASSADGGFMSAADKAKLDALPAFDVFGASLSVASGTVNVAFGGSGSAATASRSDHTHAAVTSTVNGFMIAADKVKLDGLPTFDAFGPTLALASGTVNVALAGSGAASTSARSDHVHGAATSSAAGFMAAADKSKLDGLPTFDTFGPTLALASGTLNVALAGSGTATSSSRSDHTHAAVTSTVNGFMIAADKVKLDAVPAFDSFGASLTVTSGDVNVTFGGSGTATSSSRSDHAHAAVTSTVNGFMIAADKVKLDAVPAFDSFGPSLTVTSGDVNVTYGGNGAATSASRSDHSHGNAAASDAGFMAAADKTKLDRQLLIGDAGTGLVFSASNGGTLSVAYGGNGSAQTASRSDHAHALSCVYRSASGATEAATAFCNAGEVLTGGACENALLSAGEFHTSAPVGVTIAANGTGTTGYNCQATQNGVVPVTAYAICCSIP